MNLKQLKEWSENRDFAVSFSCHAHQVTPTEPVVKLFEYPYIFTVSHLNFANGYDTKLKALQKRQRFGELNEISGNQYVKEVTNAPKDVWVVIHLYNESIPMCALVNRHLSLLARKFPETKFVKAIAKSCIENYHDNCLPTIFVYKDGKIEGKLIGVVEFGGTALTVEDLEWKLAEFGAIKTDLEENPRKGIKDMMMSSLRKASIDDN
uniref:Phosducin like 2 n=1 Tax=Laticauda laticaudata TaxID=8630 RepID=A0A8C5WRM9_LATLA